MIATVHIGRIGQLALMFAVGAAVASGTGCAAAWADPDAASSSEASSLLGLATSDFHSLLGDASPAAASTADDPFASLLALIDGVSPAPSTIGDLVGFSGSPSLFGSLTTGALDLLKPIEPLLGIDFTSTIAPLLAEDSPPSWLEGPSDITVTESQYDGMPVYDLTPADPSGDYVVAIHGGAYVDEPTLLHWLAYTDMANDTGATVVVPIYPLAPEGTAGTVEPEIAGLISSEITAEGADHVSVFGDSAGGGIALSAVELMVKDGDVLPNSMVLTSPALDNTLTNPDISLINDPVLNVPELQQDALLWAGDLPLTSPLVSPIDGSLAGLPPTFVYSGSDELLAPDVLALEKDAIAQDAPISFILRTGEIHDWALLPLGDGAQVQQQIYQELGLTDASTSAATANSDLSTEMSNVLSTISTDVTNAFSAISTDMTTLSGDFTGAVQDVLALF